MKKSFMNNIKHFVDSNVRQRIDRAANNNNDFFGDDLLVLERQFEDIRHVCVEAEKRIAAMLLSSNTSSIGTYTQNVQASLNSLSGLATASSPAAASCAPPPTHSQINIEDPHNNYSRSKSATVSHPIESSIGTSNHPSQASSGATPTTAAATSQPGEIRNDIRRHKKLPIVGFLKFLSKSCHKLKPDSLLATTLTHCSQLQTQLTKLYLSYEQTIESQCLKPIQQILEIDAPNVIKLRKLFIKSHNDLDSVKAKYNGASQKQQHQQLQTSHFTSASYTIAHTSAQQANINKLDQLKKELDDAETRFEQARDTYATELYTFVCRETELVNLFVKFYQYQAEYQQQVGAILQNSLPSLNTAIASTPRKVVFGTPLEEHLQCTGRSVSLVIELCVHLLYSNALNEEGLFRIPGSSVKIKKLKSAINAWFITLASRVELEKGQEQQQTGRSHPSLLAIHDLIKEIVGQRPQQTSFVSDTISNQQATARDDSTLTQASSSATQDQQQQLVFDVHTIAGLLKLYLRELPEPLFTYALYDQWIDATVKNMNNEQPSALEQVIRQLPKANYDNLRHLIRFLHLLTCHRDLNKMTATNLAITMAPSLIWARPVSVQQSVEQPLGGDNQQQDDMQALNMQMSSVGISASLHALVIENLISRAESLMPGSMQFALSGLNDAPAKPEKGQRPVKQDRSTKSTSPTGLSTASSSSFSSASNTSVTSSLSKTHSRKGGSMDGLLDNNNSITVDNRSSRPVSVYIQKQDQSHNQCQPPPIPPAPTARSHSRQASDSSQPNRSFSTHKPPAPPIPPLSAARRQPPTTSSHTEQVDDQSKLRNQPVSSLKSSDTPTPPVPTSLRGTGTLPSAPAGLNATRPSVPPPHRPARELEESGIDQVGSEQCISKTKSEESDNSPLNVDSKSSHSLASSGNLREYEEINPVDVDDIDISVPVSPAVSLDSSISGEDSSFDNDSQSLDHSWADCVLERHQEEALSMVESTSKDQQSSNIDSQYHDRPAPKPVERRQQKKSDTSADDKDAPPTPPVKPPRSISPKITQSTPL